MKKDCPLFLPSTSITISVRFYPVRQFEWRLESGARQMSRLADTFRSPESRVTKTIVVVDLTNSTSMKEQQPEAAWLTTYGWFFDMLGTTMPKGKGHIIKYLGDG